MMKACRRLIPEESIAGLNIGKRPPTLMVLAFWASATNAALRTQSKSATLRSMAEARAMIICLL